MIDPRTVPDLFDHAERYPHAPGYRHGSDTSEAAAEATKPHMGRLQQLVLNALQQRGDMTPDECADALEVDILSIRPRFSELARRGLIAQTGEKRANRSGLMARVWSAL